MRPTYLYTAGLVIESLLLLALYMSDPKWVYAEAAAVALAAASIMAVFERWYKRRVVNKFQK